MPEEKTWTLKVCECGRLDGNDPPGGLQEHYTGDKGHCLREVTVVPQERLAEVEAACEKVEAERESARAGEDEFKAERDREAERVEAMAWAAGYETDGYGGFDFEAVRKQIIETGHEDSQDYAEKLEQLRAAEAKLAAFEEALTSEITEWRHEASGGELVTPASHLLRRLADRIDALLEAAHLHVKEQE